MQLFPLSEKRNVFGCRTREIDGHSFEAIFDVFFQIAHDVDKPTAIIAHTIKGKAVSFMEDDNNWHYRIPTEEDLVRAKQELML